MEQNRIDLFNGMKDDGEFNGTYQEFTTKYFNNQTSFEGLYDKMVNAGDYTKPIKDFYKKFACDLTWASQLENCKSPNKPKNNTQSSSSDSLEENRIIVFQDMKLNGDFSGSYQEFITKYFSDISSVKGLHDKMVNEGDYTKSLQEFFLKFACDFSWAENESYCKNAKKSSKSDPKKSETKKDEKPKERKIDLNKCRKSIEDYYPDKEKYQRDFSFEEVEDAFEREEGKHADQILYSKGTEKRQKQMCARWEDGWRPNFGKPCDETFPIEKWCRNEKMKEIQKCLGLPAERRTGIFDDLTASRLVSKGITPDESEDISEDEYKKLCNKYTSKEQLPSDDLFESKIMKIDTTEKNEILKKHLDFKKILQEQKKFLERGLIMEQNVPEIESAKAQECISKIGRYAVRKSGRNTGKTAWVITATKDGQKWKIGDDIWIYPNGECEVFDQNEFIFHENCWSCDKARQTTQVKTVADFIFNGWLEYDDIDVNFKEKDNPNFFLKVPVLGAKDGYMYFPVWKKNIVPDNFPKNSPQGKWIESIKTNYPKMVINPTDEEIDRLSLVEIPIKGSEKYFPFGLKIYYNKSNISQYKSDDLQSSKFRTNRTPSLVECEKEINNFWEDFVQKSEINTNELKFKEQKLFVQACAAMYYKNWKPREINGKKESLGGFAGIGSGRAILDAKLGALGNVEDYDGTKRAEVNVGRRPNPWFIVLPQRK